METICYEVKDYEEIISELTEVLRDWPENLIPDSLLYI